ncbi:MAG TPA: aldehyde dehydrogenase family protein, partial [Roseibacterium sp.]|nr:aldehyde dehydrogenase family protein [Roseibacterium sp.]
MGKTLKCISPIDGSVYLEHPILSREAAGKAAADARAAQSAWAARPMAERIELVRAGVAEVGKTTDRMAIELAHQMGRPVRYGGEFGGFEERALHMADIAETALAP